MVLIVSVLDPASVADDGPSPAKRARPGKQLKRDLVFSLWQCDKKNHGWCEGRPLTVAAKFRSGDRPSPSRQSQFRTKKRILSRGVRRQPAPTTLAGKLRPSIPYRLAALAEVRNDL